MGDIKKTKGREPQLGRKVVLEQALRRQQLLDEKLSKLEQQARTKTPVEMDLLDDQIAEIDRQINLPDIEMRDTEYNEIELSPDSTDDQPIDPADVLAKLIKGVRLDDPAADTDISSRSTLRASQAVISYKSAFGKPGIVVDCEVPAWWIYRIRKDVLIPASTPNLMNWRRAGKKRPNSSTKWTVEDIAKVHGIAIEVPQDFFGNVEDLVRKVTPISGAKRDELKSSNQHLPKQPDVQLLIEWKDGLMVEGEKDERYTSWECRSGCRQLWGNARIADNYLLLVATERESGYRRNGGNHSSERSVPLFGESMPGAGSIPFLQKTSNISIPLAVKLENNDSTP